MPSIAIMLLNPRWVEHESVEALHKWLKLMRERMGSKLFTRLEVGMKVE